MPQMSPLWWLILMIMFSLTFYFILTYSYFMFIYQIKKNIMNKCKSPQPLKFIKKFNMKW